MLTVIVETGGQAQVPATQGQQRTALFANIFLNNLVLFGKIDCGIGTLYLNKWIVGLFAYSWPTCCTTGRQCK